MQTALQADTTGLAPCFVSSVPAGFPSPAETYIEGTLDLNSYLVRHPAATYFVRVKGDSMIGAGIHDGDLLVVDRAIEPRNGAVVVACLDGELTVKRLVTRNGNAALVPENPDYPALTIGDADTVEIWGVVHAVIHHL